MAEEEQTEAQTESQEEKQRSPHRRETVITVVIISVVLLFFFFQIQMFKGTAGLPVRLAGRIYTLLVACLGWVLFRADDLTMAGQQLSRMFIRGGQGHWNFTEFVGPEAGIIFILSLIFAFGWPRPCFSRMKNSSPTAAAILGNAAAILSLFLSIVMLANAAHNPFIYFRF